MTHRQTIVIALVLVAVLGVMSIALGAVNASVGEVRINAKRHEDGRTEFARPMHYLLFPPREGGGVAHTYHPEGRV